MKFIRVGGRIGRTFAIFVLAGSVGFNIYSYRRNVELRRKYEFRHNSISQLEAGSLTAFLTLEQEHEYIEIFDIKKGQVIKRVPSNPAIRREVQKYIKGITGIYTKAKAIPDKGYIVRVQIGITATENQWLKNYGINSLNEVFVIFPKEGEAYLLILDGQKKPGFYNFQCSTEVLLKNLCFDLDEAR